jgi:S1-C subfamily serine protease
VNTAIIAAAQGLGFAVPGNTAKWIVGELIVHGQIRRVLLGIAATVVRIPRYVVRQLDLLANRAVEVVEVAPGGAAQTAGLRAGDWIVAINDRVIASIDDLHRILARLPAGQTIVLHLVRQGQPLEVAVEPRLAG